MEVLGGVASIIAVIQISEQVLELCGKYASGVLHAREEIGYLTKEVKAVQCVLKELNDVIERDGKDSKAAMFDEPVKECAAVLSDLRVSLNQGMGRRKMRKLGHRALAWPFKSGDVEKEIKKLERQKTTIALALSTDIKAGVDVSYSHAGF
jgi:hypothetical protein